MWLLKRFLYRPILDGIDAREAEIALKLARAETETLKAYATEMSFQTELEDFAEQKAALLEAARDAAKAERLKLEKETQCLIDADKQEQQRQLIQVQQDYIIDLKAGGATAIASLAGKVLGDLADADLEQRIVSNLEHRLPELVDGKQIETGGKGDVLVTTRLPLPEAAQQHFSDRFQAIINGGPLRFAANPRQSPGVILTMNGRRLDWTIDRYLAHLEKTLLASLTAQDEQRASEG